MLFGTAQFVVFLTALLLILSELPRRHWNGFLLACSLLFYTLWFPAYLLLLLVDIGVNYALLGRIRGAPAGSKARRGWLIASVCFSLGLLVYFKYAVFLLANVAPGIDAVLGFQIELPEILLPLGISFYTFQIISLAADTFASAGDDDDLRIDGLAHYALYISFFPQLIAGPILRGRELLPQLRAGAQQNFGRSREGVWLIARGLAKKILMADFLLSPLVDTVFASPELGDQSHHWVALYAFSFQLYFDFSGYTDMARGIAKLIGFELPENFREPYLSRSPQEFWERWHITLSQWLRDYLYIPLGGNRRGRVRTRVNLLVTMLLCGLWHGAGWNFVAWGALNGLMVVLWPARFRRSRDDRLRLADLPRIFVVFHLWCLTLVPFRSANLSASLTYLQKLVFDSTVGGWPAFEMLVLAAALALHVGERSWRLRMDAAAPAVQVRPARLFAEAIALGALAALLIVTAGSGVDFIYFQF